MSDNAHIELAQASVQHHWNRERLEPVVAPGSYEEELALERIDQARADDMTGHDWFKSAYRASHAGRAHSRNAEYWRRRRGR